MADELTRWTAWLAMAAFGVASALCLRQTPDQPAPGRQARRLWTAACVLLWIHVACAFQFRHHWSHAEAYAYTARQTAEFVGLDWGGGLYFNYLLLVVCAGDSAWWWIGPRSYQARPAIVGRLRGGFVAFMAFNAAVVFGSGVLRWMALAGFVVLGWWAALSRKRGGSS
jgi:hypothetical protein